MLSAPIAPQRWRIAGAMRFLFASIGFSLMALGQGAACAESIRDQEIAECRSGDIAVWNDGVDRHAIHSSLRIAYRHDDAPPWFDRSEVETLVSRAANAWAGCGIPVVIVPDAQADPRIPGMVRVQWSEAGSRGNFGLSNLSARTLSLGPGAFALLRSRNPSYNAMQTLQMVLSHELGHFFGLMAHSRRCIDVLSYYHDGKGARCFTRDPAGIGAFIEYRHTLPTACDIERCRAVNGRAPLQKNAAPAGSR